MPTICKWYTEGEYNNCTCPTVLHLFSNKSHRCKGKPDPSKSGGGGGGDLPTIELFDDKGKLVDAFPCHSYKPTAQKDKDDPILIVDDDKDICETIKTVLKLEGYGGLHIATSGKEALAKLKETKYDLILLDVRMPDMNGVDVLREIRKIDKEVPVAMITAYEDIDLAKEAFRLGAYDLIRKPFDIDYLRKAVLSKLIPGANK